MTTAFGYQPMEKKKKKKKGARLTRGGKKERGSYSIVNQVPDVKAQYSTLREGNAGNGRNTRNAELGHSLPVDPVPTLQRIYLDERRNRRQCYYEAPTKALKRKENKVKIPYNK